MTHFNHCAIGAYHSFFIDTSSNLWGFGNNKYAQLGLGDKRERNLPENMQNSSQIISVCAGGSHSIFIDLHGDVFTCGNNECGQLGLGNSTNRNIPTKIKNLSQIISISAGDNHSMFLDINGTVYMWMEPVWATGIARHTR